MISELRAQELWPSPLADAALADFRIRLANWTLGQRRMTLARDFRQGTLALKQALKALWDRGQIPDFIGVATALEENHTLNSAYRRRLAVALLSLGLFDGAAEVYGSLSDDDHGRWREQALALAGAGRLESAAEAIALSAARLADGPPEANLEATVKTVGRRMGVLEAAADWPEARRRVQKRLQGDRREAAEGVLKGWFARLNQLIGELIEICREEEAGGPDPGWAHGRERALAWLLLGRPDRAARPLVAAAATAAELPADEVEDALALFRAAAAAQPAEVQAKLLAATARVVPAGPARMGLEAAMDLAGEGSGRRFAELDADPGQPALAMMAVACARAGQLGAALALFGGLTQAARGEDAPRRELVACQSMAHLRRLQPKPRSRSGSRRVFDLFPYNGELELLKIKLHEMSPWVDHFVLVESAVTFTGRPKPLHFEKDRAALEPFLPKISRVMVERFPAHVAAPWAREYHQRDEAIRALEGLWAPDDLVLLTDADEVIDHRALEGFEGDAALLLVHTFRYFLNHRVVASGAAQWGGASVWRAALLEHYSASLARAVLGPSLRNGRIEDAGWHFTSIGDAATIARKLASYSHQEHDRPDGEAHWEGVLARLRAGERQAGWEVCDPAILPAYIRDNWERLSPLLL